MMGSEMLKVICANQGAIKAEDLVVNVLLGKSTSQTKKYDLYFSTTQKKVVVRTSLKLCPLEGCQGSCGGLHLCKHFLFSGQCHLIERHSCRFSHDLTSDHNQKLLKEHELDGLRREEICTLLMQSDDTLLPQICHDYNNGEGKFGQCQDGVDCEKLHICEKFLIQDCSCSRNHIFFARQPFKVLYDYKVPSTLIHGLKAIYRNKEALKYSERDGSYRGNGSAATNADDGPNQSQWNQGKDNNGRNTGTVGNPSQQQRIVSLYDTSLDKEERNSDAAPLNIKITRCLEDSQQQNSDSYNISVTGVSSNGGQSRQWAKSPNQTSAMRGSNNNSDNDQHPNSSLSADAGTISRRSREDKQNQRPTRKKDQHLKARNNVPYSWQVCEGGLWNDLPDSETIEKDYCDPKNTYSGSSPSVHFDTMTCGPNNVRRLSTLNSQTKPSTIPTAEWLWYWQDEFGQWNLFGSDSNGQKSGHIDSVYLEQKFLNNNKDVVEFTIGSQSYSLSFQDMIQTNKNYGTKRLVITRPRFVSAADFQVKKETKPQNIPTPVPDNWDKTKILQTGYSKISLLRTSTEFETVQALFHKTMRSFAIKCIERIQNKPLWEVYQWQKNQMKINNGGLDVTEKLLFHGTVSENVDAICTNNFDWRICGSHGTSYGKGSYFARDASYSHFYTGVTSVKTVFVSRVLVGSYTKGDPGYVRPPSKDGGNTNFYDSCVNDIINPSVFVVFEKHQIYPVYLLQYIDHSANKTLSTQSPLPPAASTGQSNRKPLPMPPSNLRSKSKSLPNLNKKAKKPCVIM